MTDKYIPLKIHKPDNLAVFLTFYSPLFIALIVLSMSFIFQNFKGIVYLMWIVLFSAIRSEWYQGFEDTSSNPICSMVQYSSKGNSTFSVFFIMFTMCYICGPMFINNDINYFIFSAFLFYLFLDIGIRYYSKCINYKSNILLDFITGTGLGCGVVWLFYGANIQKYLFFNETSSNKEICSLPKKQTFKCSVYKNGELIGSSNR